MEGSLAAAEKASEARYEWWRQEMDEHTKCRAGKVPELQLQINNLRRQLLEEERLKLQRQAAAVGVPHDQRPPSLEDFLDAHAPHDMKGPITHSLFKVSVVFSPDGHSYERVSVTAHLESQIDRNARRVGNGECTSTRIDIICI